MRHRSAAARFPSAAGVLPFLLMALPAGPLRAADHVLTIGGGYAPSGNQVSLERNVLFFRQVLADVYPKGAGAPARHDVLFSDGDSPARDVQYEDPAWRVPEAHRLLARVYDEEDALGYRYRSHQIAGVRGPATREAVDRWFADVGARIPAGDRLVLYATGHGGHDDDDDGEGDARGGAGAKSFDNNRLFLWNGDALTVRELAGLLDGLPAGVEVVVVMVQCHSGGFADLLFAGGRPENGPAANVRCGFFATVPDRQAAGCTPDVNEANYQDYSSGFWAALRGATRTGAAIDAAARDFDRDGAVTFAEAHAYVLLTDDSIDIPMTTTDRFLRLNSDPGASGGRLASAEDALARLNALATPAERAVIDGLSGQLELDGEHRYAAARELAESLFARHNVGEQKERELERQLEAAREGIAASLELRWPELHNRWDPAVDRLLREQPAEVVRAIKADPRYDEFAKLHAEIAELSARDDELEARWAKCQRLLRVLERVALAHNLDKVADADVLARYQALLAAEDGTLGAAKRKR